MRCAWQVRTIIKMMKKENYENMLPGARLWTGDMEVEPDAIERRVTRSETNLVRRSLHDGHVDIRDPIVAWRTANAVERDPDLVEETDGLESASGFAQLV